MVWTRTASNRRFIETVNSSSWASAELASVLRATVYEPDDSSTKLWSEAYRHRWSEHISAKPWTLVYRVVKGQPCSGRSAKTDPEWLVDVGDAKNHRVLESESIEFNGEQLERVRRCNDMICCHVKSNDLALKTVNLKHSSRHSANLRAPSANLNEVRRCCRLSLVGRTHDDRAIVASEPETVGQ